MAEQSGVGASDAGLHIIWDMPVNDRRQKLKAVRKAVREMGSTADITLQCPSAQIAIAIASARAHAGVDLTVFGDGGYEAVDTRGGSVPSLYLSCTRRAVDSGQG